MPRAMGQMTSREMLKIQEGWVRLVCAGTEIGVIAAEAEVVDPPEDLRVLVSLTLSSTTNSMVAIEVGVVVPIINEKAGHGSLVEGWVLHQNRNEQT